jgi:hypothetical protein
MLLGGLLAVLLHALPLHTQVTVQTPEQGQAFVATAIDSARSRLS